MFGVKRAYADWALVFNNADGRLAGLGIRYLHLLVAKRVSVVTTAERAHHLNRNSNNMFCIGVKFTASTETDTGAVGSHVAGAGFVGVASETNCGSFGLHGRVLRVPG